MSNHLSAMTFGLDRYHRRYWVFPECGGIFVEGLESAYPKLLTTADPVCSDGNVCNGDEIKCEFKTNSAENHQVLDKFDVRGALSVNSQKSEVLSTPVRTVSPASNSFHIPGSEVKLSIQPAGTPMSEISHSEVKPLTESASTVPEVSKPESALSTQSTFPSLEVSVSLNSVTVATSLTQISQLQSTPVAGSPHSGTPGSEVKPFDQSFTHELAKFEDTSLEQTATPPMSTLESTPTTQTSSPMEVVMPETVTGNDAPVVSEVTPASSEVHSNNNTTSTEIPTSMPISEGQREILENYRRAMLSSAYECQLDANFQLSIPAIHPIPLGSYV